MFNYAYECSNPKLYDEFVNSFLQCNEDSSSNRALLEIDPKIVIEVKNYFNNVGIFNDFCIYNRSFGLSYRHAVKEMTVILKNKAYLFMLGRLYDEKSSIYGFPIDVISVISKKLIFQPCVKDFQCQIFKKINIENPNDKLQIVKQMQQKKCLFSAITLRHLH